MNQNAGPRVWFICVQALPSENDGHMKQHSHNAVFSLEFPEILSQNLIDCVCVWEFQNDALWDTR